MMPEPEIRKPIFIVGCPRSGTNTLYYRLAKHPDLAWISNITKKTPDSMLLTRLLMMVRKDHHPTEAKNVWRRYATADNDARGRDDATPKAKAFLRKVVGNHLAMFGKPRFINKCPRNSVRMEFLDAVFPDAFFIHMIRDGRAVANSILRARTNHGGAYWGCEPPGWQGLLDKPLLDACGLQWKMIVEHALESAKSIPPERYIEVRYEDLCDRPEEMFRAVSDKAGLEWDDAVLKELVGDIQSRNFKWRENFSPEEVETLNSLIGGLLTKLGYEV
ncbi:MAG: sulfotransferase [Planctomycetota bacterium]